MNEIRKIVTRLLLAVVISLVFESATRPFDPLVFHTSSAQSNSTENTENNATTTGALLPPPPPPLPPPSVTNEPPTDRPDDDGRDRDRDNTYPNCLRTTSAENCR